jgi:hypothetical protein
MVKFEIGPELRGAIDTFVDRYTNRCIQGLVAGMEEAFGIDFCACTSLNDTVHVGTEDPVIYVQKSTHSPQSVLNRFRELDMCKDTLYILYSGDLGFAVSISRELKMYLHINLFTGWHQHQCLSLFELTNKLDQMNVNVGVALRISSQYDLLCKNARKVGPTQPKPSTSKPTKPATVHLYGYSNWSEQATDDLKASLCKSIEHTKHIDTLYTHCFSKYALVLLGTELQIRYKDNLEHSPALRDDYTLGVIRHLYMNAPTYNDLFREIGIELATRLQQEKIDKEETA